ncbi:MAG TPA: ABC transporter ATP-binding protein, partial [Thermomicrobiales bacterium]|nr:ABC transporter ATP-binding protein [Thermomicrobiales bacterium]
TTNDLQQGQMVLNLVLRLGLYAPIMGIGAIIKAYHLAPSMTWIMAVAIGILIVIIATLFTLAIPRFTRLQQLVDRLNLVTREILNGLRVIRAFNREAYEERRFDRANEDLTQLNLTVNRLMAILQPAMLLILNITSIAVVWVGGHRIEDGSLQIGDMLAFMQYAMQAIFAFLMISMIFIMVPRAAVSSGRVAEVLQTESTIHDPKHPVSIANPRGLVEFDHVSFEYPGAERPVLNNITFTAQPGQMTAIVGPTGSGKTTLVGLIERFYDVTEGAIRIEGVDLRDMRQSDLRSRIGYVSQRAVLFSGTIESNIRYGQANATPEQLANAADTAQAREFIVQMEGEFQASIAQGGTNLSGGQKQRLAIARALARRAQIYIFDDSFSALDFRTDAMLRAALAAETAESTVIVIAQRISTIMHAARIVVLDEGSIVGQGTHLELLQTCTTYQEIAASQMSALELTNPVSALVASGSSET